MVRLFGPGSTTRFGLFICPATIRSNQSHFFPLSFSPRHVDLSDLPTEEKGHDASAGKVTAAQTPLQHDTGSTQKQVKYIRSL